MVGVTAILSGITGVFNSLFGGIDSISTTDEEKLQWKAKLTEFQVELTTKVLEAEALYVKAQQAVLTAELQHGNWLTRSWRPITMLTFLAFVVWFGIGTAFKIPVPADAFIENMMGLIKLGLGGYIIGRSFEKVAVNVVGAMKKKEKI